MNEKINKTDLIKAIADKSQLPEKQIDSYIKKLNDLLLEKLMLHKKVKMAGFGEFKLILLKTSKNSDGNDKTSYKLIFEPEEDIKQQINSDLDFLKPIELSEELASSIPLSNLSKQAEEIKDILGDIQEYSQTEPNKTDVQKVSQRPKNQNDTPKEVSIPLSVKNHIDKKKDSDTEDLSFKSKSTKGSRKKYLLLSLLLILLITLLTIFYLFFYKKYFAQNSDSDKVCQSVITQVLPEKDITEVESENILSFEDRKYEQFSDTIIVSSGNTIVQLAQKYLGNKLFWVYIFEANRDKINNPNNLFVGLEIKIPILDKSLTNEADTTLMNKIKDLESQYKIKFQ